MKKLITIMLCLILSLSVFATVGCGGGSVFNGNYKEATETEVEAFAQAVAEAEKGEEFNYNSGVKLELDISEQRRGPATESLRIQALLPACLGLNVGLAPSDLCDLKQVMRTLCSLISERGVIIEGN